ncbi:DNA repair protein RecO [Candidatus Gracilibacteria bacterium CG17_big_fil_post_rev_8_21_14_2_50_48_13]|nr:MAG: DNA repair protein RecO [Candidatus Gracilibacteria bacterium CG17_big_fil_post_rev_8_21_14_2_50_48_13]
MRSYQQTRALVVHRYAPLASGNTPVLLFTEIYGMRRVLVKGLASGKSVMASRIDPLLLLDVQFYGLDSATMLTGAAPLHRYADHALPYAAIEALWAVLGLLSTLVPEEEPHAEIFEHLCLFLSLLNTAQHPEVLSIMMQMQLLDALGHMHVSRQCMHCQTDLVGETHLHLRPRDMLFLCGSCAKKLSTAVEVQPIDPLVYKSLHVFVTKPLSMGAMLSVPAEILLSVQKILEERRRALS